MYEACKMVANKKSPKMDIVKTRTQQENTYIQIHHIREDRQWPSYHKNKETATPNLHHKQNNTQVSEITYLEQSNTEFKVKLATCWLPDLYKHYPVDDIQHLEHTLHRWSLDL